MRAFSLTVFLGFLVIISLHTVFRYTDYVQEDAFITWRCAESLLRMGVYGFNPGEKVSASTTHLYVFISAFIKFLSGEFFIPVILQLNFLVLITGLYLLAACIFKDAKKKITLWFLLSISPFALIISTSGMETSYVILFIGILAYGLHYDKIFLSTIALFLLPWIRPDAVVICLIFLIGCSIKNRKIPVFLSLILLIGMSSVLIFNYLYFGSILHQTITAKQIAYKGTYSLSIPEAVYHVFLRNGGLFAPFSSKFFTLVGGIFVALTVGIGILYIQKKWTDRNKVILLLALFAIAVFIPFLYVAGGIVFGWYLWPSSLIAFSLVAAFCTDCLIFKNEKFSRFAMLSIVFVIFIACAGQWRQRLFAGTYEIYRKNIGIFLKNTVAPHNTLMLEPAGYIPYYSELYTYDEIGLVSPDVTKYRKKYKNGWWIQFLKDKTPDYLLQRVHMRKFITLDNYQLTKNEKGWFVNNYELLYEFRYDYHAVRSNKFYLKILEGSAPVASFYLYRLKKDTIE